MAIATIVLIFVLLGLAALLLGRSRRQRQSKSDLPRDPVQMTPQAQLTKLQRDGRFRRIRIESHCSASACFAGLEYEFEAVPALPVEGCGAAVCTCRYVGLSERREVADRRELTDRRDSFRLDESERRSQSLRRKADVKSWSNHEHL
jgi:hypothetical protein